MGRKITQDSAEKQIQTLKTRIYNIERDLYFLGDRSGFVEFSPEDLEPE